MKNIYITTLATVSLSLTGMIMGVDAATAATIAHTFTLAPAELDLTQLFTVPQFDSSLGTLSQVKIDLTGTVLGDAFAENRSRTSPSTITLNLGALLSLTGPGSLNLDVNPVNTQTFNATIFDRVLDFGGTSGITYLGLAATDTDSLTLFSDFSPYIGLGNVSFTLNGLGASTATGGGNITSGFDSFASAEILITYEYEPTPIPIPKTPEPSALVALGLVSGLGCFGKKKKKTQ